MPNQLPLPFEQQMLSLLGTEYPGFATALSQPAPVSIRLNPAKQLSDNTSVFPVSDPVHWHPDGRYLPERLVFTLDPLLHAGVYYVQEASSMFLYEALRQTLDLNASHKVLDLCAAPGGKSTLLLAAMPNSLVISNEVIRSRTNSLRENLERWGDTRSAVTSAEAADFARLGDWFDLVVTDAPCSGEGLFRKDPEAAREWSPEHVAFCAARQKTILAEAIAALKPGGLLVYSTCTYNRQENEENAAWFCRDFPLQPVQLNIPGNWGIAALKHGFQFYPHRLRGEGFYIALFRKDGATNQSSNKPPDRFRSLQPLSKKQIPLLEPWLRPDAELAFFQTPSGTVLAFPTAFEPAYRYLDQALKIKWFGIEAGSFKGTDFIPSHALALSTDCAPDLPGVEFSREQALLFLKKETFELPPGAPAKGWALARYRGFNLGWMKVLPNRWNNYLPAERRIRMQIPDPRDKSLG